MQDDVSLPKKFIEWAAANNRPATWAEWNRLDRLRNANRVQDAPTYGSTRPSLPGDVVAGDKGTPEWLAKQMVRIEARIKAGMPLSDEDQKLYGTQQGERP